MRIFVVLPYYFAWHYSRALKDMMQLWKNFMIFVYKFFSIHTLLLNFFSPLKRMGEGYTSRFDPKEFFNTLVVNTIMRFVGAVTRVVLICIGIASLCISFVIMCFLSVLWIVAPALIFSLCISGFIQLMM